MICTTAQTNFVPALEGSRDSWSQPPKIACMVRSDVDKFDSKVSHLLLFF